METAFVIIAFLTVAIAIAIWTNSTFDRSSCGFNLARIGFAIFLTAISCVMVIALFIEEYNP